MHRTLDPKSRRRDPSQPKGRQVSDALIAEIEGVLGELPRRRDLLIEALHLIQDTYTYLSAPHLTALAEILRMAPAEVNAVASFYHHFDIVRENDTHPAPVTVRVCDGLSCQMTGAEDLIAVLRTTVESADVRVQRVPCIGRCAGAPAAQVGKRAVDTANVAKVTKALVGSLDPIIPDYQKLDTYRTEGGYRVLRQVQSGDLTAEAVIEAMSDAGLRGLGGAGFPAHKKWAFVRGYEGPRLMTVNGDEGEPGTFKDRYWLERVPHKMLEGAQIAAHTVGCERIYIYMRDEYPAVLDILKAEIAALDASDIDLIPMELRRGAGAYICGEESAMIESIEGKRGLPRLRPPYIAEVGLFGRPTLNHNVETLLWIPEIVANGGGWFADHGYGPGHNGLRSFSVSGRVQDPGVKLAPAGIPLRVLIDDYCGGIADGHAFKAFLPGGASGGIFPASMAKLPLDFGVFEPHGGLIGSHAVVILSDQDSIRDAALNTMRFFKHESCGQCTPCRAGTSQLVSMLQDPATDHQLYSDLIRVMGDSSICGLGQAAANCVQHLMRYFPEEMA